MWLSDQSHSQVKVFFKLNLSLRSITGCWSYHQQLEEKTQTKHTKQTHRHPACLDNLTMRNWKVFCWAGLRFVGQVSNRRREISLFMEGDSVPFRPRHGRVHQSHRMDEDAASQWPCCGPIKSHGLWHRCLTLTSGNENYSSDSLFFFVFSPNIKLSNKTRHCSGAVALK